MKTAGDRIKACREDLGITQAELAKKAGLKSQSIIGALESGYRRRSAHMPVIARALGVEALWLAEGKGPKHQVSISSVQSNISTQQIAIGGRVPLISLVAAGNWRESVDNFAPGTAADWIETTYKAKRHTYALRVEGDSMEPRFPHGAILIVEPEDEARNGSFVIVRQNGSEATFKQLVVDGGQSYLKPLNDRYPIMPMQPDAMICGVVKQMVMDV